MSSMKKTMSTIKAKKKHVSKDAKQILIGFRCSKYHLSAEPNLSWTAMEPIWYLVRSSSEPPGVLLFGLRTTQWVVENGRGGKYFGSPSCKMGHKMDEFRTELSWSEFSQISSPWPKKSHLAIEKMVFFHDLIASIKFLGRFVNSNIFRFVCLSRLESYSSFIFVYLQVYGFDIYGYIYICGIWYIILYIWL